MPPKKQPKGRRQPLTWRQRLGNSVWLWRLRRVVLVALLLPYGLALLYLIVPPPSTLMLYDWVTGNKVTRHWIPLSQMPPVLVAAVVTAEDSAFCSHMGVDFRQLKKSVRQAHDRDKPVRATSTITQQTAKNLFLWHGRSWVRKFLEFPLAMWLEVIWSKKRIAEVYLNVAQWGNGVYGVEAAARAHFGVPARALSVQQAALLTTSLPNPIARNAGRPGPRQKVLAANLMGRLGKKQADLSCLR